jgi:hypothetical protein
VFPQVRDLTLTQTLGIVPIEPKVLLSKLFPRLKQLTIKKLNFIPLIEGSALKHVHIKGSSLCRGVTKIYFGAAPRLKTISLQDGHWIVSFLHPLLHLNLVSLQNVELYLYAWKQWIPNIDTWNLSNSSIEVHDVKEEDMLDWHVFGDSSSTRQSFYRKNGEVLLLSDFICDGMIQGGSYFAKKWLNKR